VKGRSRYPQKPHDVPSLTVFNPLG